ncbi:MAG: hypothetical protein KKH21_02285 [Gammaproteobacteria bacterium]|nr:hypothetical protein [Gammaproteobacteria bacterium]
MFILKLILVPAFLLLVSLAGRRWGPNVAGWLAGLPVVVGPILFFIAVERGASFASGAAVASLAAVFASISFSVAYAHTSQRCCWPLALFAGLFAWALAAFLLSLFTASVVFSCFIATSTLLSAARLFPRVHAPQLVRSVSAVDLALRMAAGALLTVWVTLAAGTLGSQWSGLLAVFPVLGIVLAVFSHRSQGSAFAASLLRAMVSGLYSFSVFCLVLAVALPSVGIPIAFTLSVALAVAVQFFTRRHLAPPSSGLPVDAAQAKL